jgi:hypothetical protein
VGPEPTRFRLTVQALPSAVPAARRLARGLKYLLRACGLKCVAVEELPARPAGVAQGGLGVDSEAAAPPRAGAGARGEGRGP